MSNDRSDEPARLGNLLLQTGVALIKSGAGSSRIITNLSRFAIAYGYEANVDLGTRNISISLHQETKENIFSGSRSIATLPGANFRVISVISRLSWDVMEKKISLEDYAKVINQVPDIPTYKRPVILLFTGIAGSAFCFTFGGNALEMVLTFLATVIGLFFKQELVLKKYNPFMVTFGSAMVASAVIALCGKIFGVDTNLDHAFATCILFLIPGVLLINSFVDLLDGHIINGIDRGTNALIHAFAIASGLATVLYIFKML
ncbi:threonine/serine exporter family protein [Aquiflexum sp. TKW24L]|uniref:threonine/serine ThrE exporter family protein n=1 Tax=Aquiflexum sp. TKW24L TaxID=2942212 RepID=UPI0020BD4C44|nr:threonine/serine exporter family protein [Aquiflexum sp. TKW24L]MCL6260133.1 threonine/serine exporter family protein [Aquiflexum sp. TKW24L]